MYLGRKWEEDKSKEEARKGEEKECGINGLTSLRSI